MSNENKQANKQTDEATSNTELRLSPIVKFVGIEPDDEHDFSWDELIEGTEWQDPASISDRDLIALVARALDRSVADLGDLKINRPETGNILIRPVPRFGNV